MAAAAPRSNSPTRASVWSALGLVKPTYDLYTNALNGLTDSVGGFYFPWNSELYVIGTGFSGIERFVCSLNTGMPWSTSISASTVSASILLARAKSSAARRCPGVHGQGDATLVITQWWEQYASPDDYFDILNFNPPAQTLPEQFPPPFVFITTTLPTSRAWPSSRLSMPEDTGHTSTRLTTSCPRTTEQILHPSKYFAGEVGAVVGEIPLGDVLGPGWRQFLTDALGK